MLPNLPAFLSDLNCSSNQLISLPSLPTSIRYLSCSNNQLTNLSSLPLSLWQLVCSDNQLINLPTLPLNLKLLECVNCSLAVLPSFPSTLYILDCSYNELTTLPVLPTDISTLICSYNQLTCLPLLPNPLTELFIGGNNINCLPNIPTALYNDIQGLPICDIFNAANPTTIGPIIGATNICPNSTNQYEAPLVNEAVSYSWSLPNGWSGTSITNIITAIGGVTSDNITVTALNACGTQAFSSQLITISTPSVKTVSLINTTVSSDQEGATYQWIDCAIGNTPIIGENGQSFIATENGDYAVVIWKESCYPDTSACTSIRLTGMESAEHQNQISLYPNPSKGHITITSADQIITSIHIINSEGGTIQQIQNPDISNALEIDLSNESKGLYMIQFMNTEGIISKKIVLN